MEVIITDRMIGAVGYRKALDIFGNTTSTLIPDALLVVEQALLYAYAELKRQRTFEGTRACIREIHELEEKRYWLRQMYT
jgi:hypothetical protein